MLMPKTSSSRIWSSRALLYNRLLKHAAGHTVPTVASTLTRVTLYTSKSSWACRRMRLSAAKTRTPLPRPRFLVSTGDRSRASVSRPHVHKGLSFDYSFSSLYVLIRRRDPVHLASHDRDDDNLPLRYASCYACKYEALSLHLTLAFFRSLLDVKKNVTLQITCIEYMEYSVYFNYWPKPSEEPNPQRQKQPHP